MTEVRVNSCDCSVRVDYSQLGLDNPLDVVNLQVDISDRVHYNETCVEHVKLSNVKFVHNM